MPIVLQTPRLLLRTFREDDLDALAAIYADPEVVRCLGAGAPIPRDQIQRYIASAIVDETYGWPPELLTRLPHLMRAREKNAHFSLWATVDRATNQLIGRCGLLAWNLDGQLETEVGYVLARHAWGKGLATEAACAIRDYGFDRLAFDRLISVINPANIPSQRVATKIGMTLDRETTHKGTPIRIYAITRAHRDALQSSASPS